VTGEEAAVPVNAKKEVTEMTEYTTGTRNIPSLAASSIGARLGWRATDTVAAAALPLRYRMRQWIGQELYMNVLGWGFLLTRCTGCFLCGGLLLPSRLLRGRLWERQIGRNGARVNDNLISYIFCVFSIRFRIKPRYCGWCEIWRTRLNRHLFLEPTFLRRLLLLAGLALLGGDLAFLGLWLAFGWNDDGRKGFLRDIIVVVYELILLVVLVKTFVIGGLPDGGDGGRGRARRLLVLYDELETQLVRRALVVMRRRSGVVGESGDERGLDGGVAVRRRRRRRQS
jgi:hypothetical protein